MDTRTDADVAVVGASLAGCTAATLLGRAGLRVVVLERAPSPEAYKRLCTHFLQPSAVPTLERLGVVDAMRAAGALPNLGEVHSRYGWLRPRAADGEALPHGYSLSRKRLDPIMRGAAAGTPGVEVRHAQTVIGLDRDADGRICTVRARGRDGGEHVVTARVVVGADGRGSEVARMAQVRGRSRPNARFGFWAAFRGARLSGSPGASQLWFLDPGAAFAFPNEDGITLIGALSHERDLPAWRADREGELARALAALPDGPDLSGAERVGPLMGSVRLTSTIRPAARPGLALAGDAAMACDPLWGVGCGFALQSAEWLADELADPLLEGSDSEVDAALARYARTHRHRLAGHHALINDYSTGRRFTPLERMLYVAGTRDPVTARRMHSLASRMAPPGRLLARIVARGALVAASGAVRDAAAAVR